MSPVNDIGVVQFTESEGILMSEFRGSDTLEGPTPQPSIDYQRENPNNATAVHFLCELYQVTVVSFSLCPNNFPLHDNFLVSIY
jgi:hypothetical protein